MQIRDGRRAARSRSLDPSLDLQLVERLGRRMGQVLVLLRRGATAVREGPCTVRRTLPVQAFAP